MRAVHKLSMQLLQPPFGIRSLFRMSEEKNRFFVYPPSIFSTISDDRTGPGPENLTVPRGEPEGGRRGENTLVYVQPLSGPLVGRGSRIRRGNRMREAVAVQRRLE